MRYDRQRVDALAIMSKTKEVVDELLQLNYGLIDKQLRKLYVENHPDALSFGYEALYNAIMTYDHKKKIRFSTYASVCIYNAIGNYIRKLKSMEATQVISLNAPIKGMDNICL